MEILAAVAHGRPRGRVLAYATDLARLRDAELRVVHFDGEREDADERLRERVREHVVDAGVTATVSVEPFPDGVGRDGPAVGRRIAEVAGETGADHVVVGHATTGVFDRLTAGSAAFTLADDAAVPVTVVPDGDDGPADESDGAAKREF